MSGILIFLLVAIWKYQIYVDQTYQSLCKSLNIPATKTSPILLSLVILLCGSIAWCVLLYNKIKQQEKIYDQEIKIVRKGLIEIGDLKWMATYFNDACANVENIPFCKTHEARLVQHDDAYICSINFDCSTRISLKDIKLLHKQAESIVEADILRMIKNAKQKT